MGPPKLLKHSEAPAADPFVFAELSAGSSGMKFRELVLGPIRSIITLLEACGMGSLVVPRALKSPPLRKFRCIRGSNY